LFSHNSEAGNKGELSLAHLKLEYELSLPYVVIHLLFGSKCIFRRKRTMFDRRDFILTGSVAGVLVSMPAL
jgi:hypothetical protein